MAKYKIDLSEYGDFDDSNSSFERDESGLKEFAKSLARYGKAQSKGKSKLQSVSDLDEAQEIMNRAYATKNPKKRIQMAKNAMLISADCADAYMLLANENSDSTEKKIQMYSHAMDASRRTLGEDFFEENSGHFWVLEETRTFMKAKQSVLLCLFAVGRNEEAISHANELLNLNPNDNQGIRYLLLNMLMETRKYKEAEILFKNPKYSKDNGIEWLYSKALLSFVKEGSSTKSKKALEEAMERNSFAPTYLKGIKPLPMEFGELILMGSEDEGAYYAFHYLPAWQNAPGAIEWLSSDTPEKIIPIKKGKN